MSRAFALCKHAHNDVAGLWTNACGACSSSKTRCHTPSEFLFVPGSHPPLGSTVPSVLLSITKTATHNTHYICSYSLPTLDAHKVHEAQEYSAQICQLVRRCPSVFGCGAATTTTSNTHNDDVRFVDDDDDGDDDVRPCRPGPDANSGRGQRTHKENTKLHTHTYKPPFSRQHGARFPKFHTHASS